MTAGAKRATKAASGAAARKASGATRAKSVVSTRSATNVKREPKATSAASAKRTTKAGRAVGLPENAVHPRSRAEWRAWLEAHHTRPTGVWLVSFKRSTGKPRVEYDAAVEEALCFGWIDSVVHVLDEARAMQWFSPRKPGSRWAPSNKGRVDRMLAAGLMRPAGLAVIARAKADGSWTAYDDANALRLPPDLRDALAGRGQALANFDAQPPSHRRAILSWIQDAKRPETRARRIAETVDRARRNVRDERWQSGTTARKTASAAKKQRKPAGP